VTGHSPRPDGPTATIAATAVCVPPHVLVRDDVKTYMRRVFDIGERRLDTMMEVIDNSGVSQRHTVLPVEEIITTRSLGRVAGQYREHAIQLGRRAAEDCLERAGLTPRAIDVLITVSCTGFMIPSLDAHLIELMGFRRDVRRLPVTELGCAAGAMSLSMATDLLRAVPGGNVLILSVELPTLTFQRGDLSQANLVSCVLFGDGAAAALVTSRPVPGPRILDTRTHTFPHSLDAMGFDLRDTGFHIVLSKDVPHLIRDNARAIVEPFLERSGLTLEQLSAFLFHPGGRKVLAFLEAALGLCRTDTRISRDILSRYGNLSSATILFVLDAWLAEGGLPPGGHGLAAAFGPGFSAELILLGAS
jgi:alkylresorcinol/alkylpyrone synthase